MPPSARKRCSNVAREDTETSKQFKKHWPTPTDNQKVLKAEYIHCHQRLTQNITLGLHPHLLKCHVYKQIREEQEVRTQAKKASEIPQFFEPISTDKDELFTIVVFTSTTSFSMFDTDEQKEFFKALNYKTLKRTQLSSTLLNRCYTRVKAQVQSIADSASNIQIVTDGSTNIAKTCIENVSFLVDNILYYQKSIGVGAVKIGADWSVRNLVDSAKEITQNALNRWTSYSSDTCPTQRAIQRCLCKELDYQYILSIPCDSYSIQLIFRDLLQLIGATPSISNFFSTS